MTEYLKMVPLPSWWYKLDQKNLSRTQLFEEVYIISTSVKSHQMAKTPLQGLEYKHISNINN